MNTKEIGGENNLKYLRKNTGTNQGTAIKSEEIGGMFSAKTDDYSQRLFDKLIWLTVKQAAIYLSRTENAIRLLVHKGTLQRHRLDGRIYLKKAEIDRLLEKSILGGNYGG